MLRLLLALVCGGVIGYGRSKKERAAGLRTYMLISVGAAMAVLISIYEYQMLFGDKPIWALLVPDADKKFDASRLASQVITGIGFLGAGIIITKKMTIKGLTTAAGLWTTGIIGIAIGNGYYELGLLGTGLVLLTETWVAKIGGTIQKHPTFVMEVLYNDKDALDDVLRFCKDKRMSILRLHIKSLEEHPPAKYAAEITLRGTEDSQTLVNRVQLMHGIAAADVT